MVKDEAEPEGTRCLIVWVEVESYYGRGDKDKGMVKGLIVIRVSHR